MASSMTSPSNMEIPAEVCAEPMFLLQHLIENRLPVYVENMTRPRGRITLTMVSPTGRTQRVEIPKDPLPFPVTDHCDHATISNSPDFRSMVGKRLLTVMPPLEALKEMRLPENQDMLLDRQDAMKALTDTGGMDPDEADVVSHKNALHTFSVDASPDGEINPRVMVIVDGVTSGTLGSRQAVRELKMIGDQLAEQDMAYVMDRCRDGSVKEAVKRLLADKRSGDGGDMPPMPSAGEINP